MLAPRVEEETMVNPSSPRALHVVPRIVTDKRNIRDRDSDPGERFLKEPGDWLLVPQLFGDVNTLKCIKQIKGLQKPAHVDRFLVGEEAEPISPDSSVFEKIQGGGGDSVAGWITHDLVVNFKAVAFASPVRIPQQPNQHRVDSRPVLGIVPIRESAPWRGLFGLTLASRFFISAPDFLHRSVDSQCC